MNTITVFGIEISTWVVIPLIYFLWVTVLLYAKRVVFKVVKKFSEKSKTKLDDAFIQSSDFPLTLLIFTSGGIVIDQFLPYATRMAENADLTNFFLIALKVVAVVAVILFADKFTNFLMKEYSSRVEILRTSGGIARGIVRVVVIGLGVLILLDSFGVSITPLIASLGVGSLAVALALQPTLENFFAGVQLVIDKPIQVGQFVKIESGEEGYVHKIGWRSTWVRMLPNNVVVIPNKSLVTSKIVNYYYPEQEMSVLVQVGVHYGSDLEQVERVTVEVGKEILKEVDGGVESFEPFIRYHTFDSSSINFSVILRAQEFVNQYLIKHEFIKRLHKRFKQEGITIPYPIRAINYDQEKAFEEVELTKKR